MNDQLTPDRDDVEINQWVYREKIKMLYGNFRQSWMLSLMVSALLAYLSVDSGSLTTGIIWWLVFAFIILLRHLLVQRFFKSDIPLGQYRLWCKRFFLLAMLSGIAWAAGGFLIGSELDQVGHVFVLIIMIGVAGGSIPLLGVHMPTMLAFQIPTALPYLAWVAIHLEDRGGVLITIGALFMLSVTITMKRLEKSVFENLRLKYEMEHVAEQLKDSNQKLEQLSLLDPLTQLNNRRYFDMQMDKEWKRALRHQEVISLLMIDIDYFKLYNDRYGHDAGDKCLRSVATILKAALHRPTDIMARLGGEEFVALLPSVDQQGAEKIARVMRTLLWQAGIAHEASPVSDYVTMSIGVASVIPQSDTAPLCLLKVADMALYQAKNKGRDRIVTGEFERMSMACC